MERQREAREKHRRNDEKQWETKELARGSTPETAREDIDREQGTHWKKQGTPRNQAILDEKTKETKGKTRKTRGNIKTTKEK